MYTQLTIIGHNRTLEEGGMKSVIIFLSFNLELIHGSAIFNSRLNNFSMELIDSTRSDNVVIASFSVWCLLASVGLWTSGDSREEFTKAIKLLNNKTIFLDEYSTLKRTIFDEKSKGINITSGIFIFTSTDCKIFPAFRETMTSYFGAVIETLNFDDRESAAQTANDLVHTNVHTIFNIFVPDDFVNTTMIMSSVISFDASWKYQFDPRNTTIERYTSNKNNSICVTQMMHKRLTVPYSNLESLNANVMELPLGQDGKFCLLLILPYQNKNISEIYRKLYKITLKDIFDKLQSEVNEFGLKEIDFSLPKVRIETGIVLNKPLKDIGLNEVFESNQVSFMGITKDNLFISSIDHTCVLVILERGVFALASTPGYPKYNTFSKIEAKQSFIFFVMEKPTQTVLFGGIHTKTSCVLET